MASKKKGTSDAGGRAAKGVKAAMDESSVFDPPAVKAWPDTTLNFDDLEVDPEFLETPEGQEWDLLKRKVRALQSRNEEKIRFYTTWRNDWQKDILLQLKQRGDYDARVVDGIRKGFSKTLDHLANMVEARPQLLQEFKDHRLMDLIFNILSKSSKDPIYLEIAEQVKIRWADRKSPAHMGEPWTKSPNAFIRHVYSKWLNAGTLRRAHLAWDENLYRAYIAQVRRHPEADLGLPADQRRPIADPNEALQRKRAYAAKHARDRRSKVP